MVPTPMHENNLSDARIPSGSRFAGYEIVARIKAGGMGMLYQARALDTGEMVVLKVLHEHLARDAEFVRMFENEGRLASQINHPKVVRVHDLGSQDGRRYLVMEFVAGCSLGDLLKLLRAKQVSFPLELAVWIVAEAAAALHVAHEAKDDDGVPLNIVHRDVSPENILLSWRGAVKLTDFGIAKARTIHTTGAFKGKVRYMAPEQARGEMVDRRADIYALGMVLWELLAGRPRFTAETDFALLRQVSNPAPAPVSRYASDVPPSLDSVLARALMVEREDRFDTAKGFGETLMATQPGGSARELKALMAEHAYEIQQSIPPPSETPSAPQTRRHTTNYRRITQPPRRRRDTRSDSAPATMPGRTSLVTAVVREMHHLSSSLIAQQSMLERRLGMMARVGPKLTPGLFTAPDERLAYNLNAFITMAALMLTRVPQSGAHHNNRRPTNPYGSVTIDGRMTTLNDLDGQLRDARDARLYAAVLAALHSDAWTQPYTGENLEQHLEGSMRRIINSDAFLQLDHNDGLITLRASMRPFMDWFGQRARDHAIGRSWFDLLIHYAREPLHTELSMARDIGYEVVFSNSMPALDNIAPPSSLIR